MTGISDTAALAAIGAAARELKLPTVRADAARLAEIVVRERQTHLAYLAELVTGSNPVAPTNKALTSGNDAALTITVLSRRNAGQFAVWGPVPGTGYRMESVSLA
jgi:hypothetical protein